MQVLHEALSKLKQTGKFAKAETHPVMRRQPRTRAKAPRRQASLARTRAAARDGRCGRF